MIHVVYGLYGYLYIHKISSMLGKFPFIISLDVKKQNIVFPRIMTIERNKNSNMLELVAQMSKIGVYSFYSKTEQNFKMFIHSISKCVSSWNLVLDTIAHCIILFPTSTSIILLMMIQSLSLDLDAQALTSIKANCHFLNEIELKSDTTYYEGEV